MASSKYESTKGTTHLARIARAILGPCIDVLREVLAKEISPSDLERKVKTYIRDNRKPSINEQQKRLVYGKNYSVFDVTLLYFLFRNISSIPPHKNKWGKDPELTDKSVSANIERIRILRNEWYGHATDFSLSDSDFEQRWNHISQIVIELEGHLGTATKYKDTLIELKTCCMDPGSIQHYIDTLKVVEELQTDVTILNEGVGELQTDVTNLKEDVERIQNTIETSRTKEMPRKRKSTGGAAPSPQAKKAKKRSAAQSKLPLQNFQQLSLLAPLILNQCHLQLPQSIVQNQHLFQQASQPPLQDTQSVLLSLQQPREESQIEKAIFDQWEQDDFCFISTNACKEVEKIIKSSNLVIVGGHSGSGKSAIIQHIALKYREQGWTVKRVKEVKDIVNECASSRFQKNKTMCVFNDPLGKESFDEILNNLWQTHEEELKLYLKTSKLVMSSRNHIIRDTRVTRYLVNQSHIVNIDDNKYKLSVKEKRQILNKYTSDMNLSDKDRDKLVEVERYFPLLCKMCSSKEEYKHKGIEFFTEPVTVLKEEILGFRNKDKGKYCALALLLLFNDDLCVNDLLKNKDNEKKFKQMLKLCGLQKKTPPSAIGDNFSSMKDCFVKKIGDTYHFYHDFVMEVTTYVFGTDYPAETIKHADIGFLRKRVKLENCDEHGNSFIIYLSDRYIEELGERLYTELFGKRLVDVVLNPCLRNEKVIEVMNKKMADYPENLQMLLETKKLTIDKQKLDRASDKLLISKLTFLELEKEVSPLFALIVFCHTQLSQCCVNILQQKQINLTRFNLISALCCNGSKELFNNVLKDNAEESFKKTWGGLCPIHILSVFHNHELLEKLIKKGLKVNQKTDGYGGWTPLMLAAGNDSHEYGDYKHRESGAIQRDKTVQLLLSNGADINLCEENGTSPLLIACQYGHDSTVQLLLSNGADINLCEENGCSPLWIACHNGHDSTVQLLLSNGADINLYKKTGASPLFIACQNGHDSTVQLLLSNGADINLCKEEGCSPLYIACQNGHDSTVQLLLSNGADINLCMKYGVSPLFIAFVWRQYKAVNI